MASTPLPPQPQPGPYADLHTFTWSKPSLRNSLVAALPVFLAFTLGVLAHHPVIGLLIGAGAQQVGFGYSQQIRGSHLWPMLAATAVIVLSTFVGMFAGHRGWGVIVAGFLWAFVYGLVSSRAAGTAWVVQQAAVTLLVTSAFPASAVHALERASLTGIGGLLQIALMACFFSLTPELRTDLDQLPALGRQGYRQLRHTFGLRRDLRRLRGLPRVLPRLLTAASVDYGLRLGLTVTLATLLYRHFGVQSGYWIPMTALIVQRPAFAQTLTRALLRIGGTLGGAILGTLLLHYLHPAPLILAVLAAFFCFGSYYANSINYGIFAFFLTGYIVFLLSLYQIPGPEIAHRRAFATLAGGLIALLIHLDALRHRHHPAHPTQTPPA